MKKLKPDPMLAPILFISALALIIAIAWGDSLSVKYSRDKWQEGQMVFLESLEERSRVGALVTLKLNNLVQELHRNELLPEYPNAAR